MHSACMQSTWNQPPPPPQLKLINVQRILIHTLNNYYLQEACTTTTSSISSVLENEILLKIYLLFLPLFCDVIWQNKNKNVDININYWVLVYTRKPMNGNDLTDALFWCKSRCSARTNKFYAKHTNSWRL